MMIATETALENLTLDVRQEIHVKASLETVFEALLEQLGPHNEVENGPMPMKLEAWPGGRWQPWGRGDEGAEEPSLNG